MSSDLFATAAGLSSPPHAPESEIMPYLEDLADRIKSRSHIQESDNKAYWNLIDRVLAYAASAEQHIAEQQSRIKELENLSTTDELTGLANRRALKSHLQRVLSSASRHDETGVVAFVDMDFFKEINDQFGHDTGDLALKTVARILKENMRNTDFAARLSGDEFVFVLEKADIAQGKMKAELIRKTICETTLPVRGKEISLSASIGVASYDKDSKINSLLSEADKAMYKDKADRRKCGT